MDKDKINICELLTEAVMKTDFIAKKKNIRIVLSFNLDENMSSDQAIVLGDYASLLNVFLNILENAIKYSSDNSEIICTVKSN